MSTIYATADQFVANFGEKEAISLTNLGKPPAANMVVDNDILNQNIQFASAEIDGYLLPSQQVATPNLTRICLDIARYRLDKNSQRKDVRQRYEDAIEYLKRMASTAEFDDVTDADQDGQQADGAIAYVPGVKRFTHSSLRNYGRWNR